MDSNEDEHYAATSDYDPAHSLNAHRNGALSISPAGSGESAARLQYNQHLSNNSHTDDSAYSDDQRMSCSLVIIITTFQVPWIGRDNILYRRTINVQLTLDTPLMPMAYSCNRRMKYQLVQRISMQIVNMNSFDK
jgi:hypothetical protein